MIKSVDSLIGQNGCSEAVFVQERQRWAAAVLMVGACPFGMAIGASFSTGVTVSLMVLTWVLFVAALVTYFVATGFWILARVGDDVVLARSSKWMAKAVEVTSVESAPLDAEVERWLGVQLTVEMDGHRLIAGRQFEKRLLAILT